MSLVIAILIYLLNMIFLLYDMYTGKQFANKVICESENFRENYERTCEQNADKQSSNKNVPGVHIPGCVLLTAK